MRVSQSGDSRGRMQMWLDSLRGDTLSGPGTWGCSDVDGATSEAENEPGVGFEVLQMLSPNEIVVWLNQDGLTEEAFDAIELDAGWFKNQPREGDADGGRFFASLQSEGPAVRGSGSSPWSPS